ncbi:hypothetical protein HDU86_004559 [Geranomyces michiganensis]|nr:hypothetical protein HDU86_004559 [Geranomyces michiganensis]
MLSPPAVGLATRLSGDAAFAAAFHQLDVVIIGLIIGHEDERAATSALRPVTHTLKTGLIGSMHGDPAIQHAQTDAQRLEWPDRHARYEGGQEIAESSFNPTTLHPGVFPENLTAASSAEAARTAIPQVVLVELTQDWERTQPEAQTTPLLHGDSPDANNLCRSISYVLDNPFGLPPHLDADFDRVTLDWGDVIPPAEFDNSVRAAVTFQLYWRIIVLKLGTSIPELLARYSTWCDAMEAWAEQHAPSVDELPLKGQLEEEVSSEPAPEAAEGGGAGIDDHSVYDKSERQHSSEEEGTRFYKGRVEVPDRTNQLKVITLCHDAPMAGNYGMKKALELLERNFYWPNMAQM